METEWQVYEGGPLDDGAYTFAYEWKVGSWRGRAWGIGWVKDGVIADSEDIPWGNEDAVTHYMPFGFPDPPDGTTWGAIYDE